MGESETTFIEWREFLEHAAPGSERIVVNAYGTGGLQTPDLSLHCEVCSGGRKFAFMDKAACGHDYLIAYQCRNCEKEEKVFALRFQLTGRDPDGGMAATVLKLGEIPAFGERFSRRVLDLAGDSKEMLLRGRRSENQGLGIGAYGYYRRVVEDAKKTLFERILTVAKGSGAPDDMIGDIEAAMAERQFSNAVEKIKHGIPDRLRINGHNPLTLLHDTLSKGLHEMTEEECLQRATDARVVLCQLVEDLDAALREDHEVKAAVARMTQRHEEKTPG